MKKFTVLLQCYVEQTAEIEVWADNLDAAKDMALTAATRAVWGPGEDSSETEAYGVKDAAGALIWER